MHVHWDSGRKIFWVSASQNSPSVDIMFKHPQKVRDQLWQWINTKGPKHVPRWAIRLGRTDYLYLYITNEQDLEGTIAHDLSKHEVYDHIEMYLNMLQLES